MTVEYVILSLSKNLKEKAGFLDCARNDRGALEMTGEYVILSGARSAKSKNPQITIGNANESVLRVYFA